MHNLQAVGGPTNGSIDLRDFLARADVLAACDKTVLISDYCELTGPSALGIFRHSPPCHHEMEMREDACVPNRPFNHAGTTRRVRVARFPATSLLQHFDQASVGFIGGLPLHRAGGMGAGCACGKRVRDAQRGAGIDAGGIDHRTDQLDAGLPGS